MTAGPVLVPIGQIEIGERARKEMGDIQGLADSIRSHGLLHPIVVTRDWRLVAGQRRIEAARLMGMAEISATVVDVADLLAAERDENEVRKNFTPTEAVAIARLIEEQSRPEFAAVRIQKQLATKARLKAGGVKVSHSAGRGPQARDAAAAAVGLSGPTYQRAKAVVVAAEAEPEKYGDLPALMDQTGNVVGTYRELEHRRNGTSGRHAIHYKRHVPKTNEIVRRAVAALEGICAGLDEVNPRDIDAAEAPAWRAAINGAAETLRRFARRLKA